MLVYFAKINSNLSQSVTHSKGRDVAVRHS